MSHTDLDQPDLAALRAFGYRVAPFGSGRACLVVTCHRKRGTEAGP